MLKPMILKINNENIELTYSFRINVYFEQITNHSIDFNNFTANDLLNLFYCTVYATLQKAKKPVISMNDFLDIIDDNGGDKCLLKFSNWFIETMKAEYSIEDAEDVKEVKQDPSKKKN